MKHANRKNEIIEKKIKVLINLPVSNPYKSDKRISLKLRMFMSRWLQKALKQSNEIQYGAFSLNK